MQRLVISAFLAALVAAPAGAAEVSGRVVMPEVCSPGVSPAVVILEPVAGGGGGGVPPAGARSAEVALVDQRGLQFVPRIQAMTVGGTLRFTNADSERHSVHVLTPGFDFNQSMAPGEPRDWSPGKPGVVRLACDIHSHMRGYVVVSDSPWVRVCTRDGRFRLDGVPDGRYVLNVWHEVGEPLRRSLTVAGDRVVDLGTLALSGPPAPVEARQNAPVRPWPEVIDQISLKLAESLDAAIRPGEFKKARRLAEDAYWGQFEASDMETAVRNHLGYARAGELEGQFLAIVADVRKVAEHKVASDHLAELSRRLLLDLVRAGDELARKGVTDRAHVFTVTTPAPSAAPVAAAPAAGDPRALLEALGRGLSGVRALADQGEADDAASAMTSVYWSDFEPVERALYSRTPQAVAPLESRFNTLRGEVGKGLRGPALAAKLTALEDEVKTAVAVLDPRRSGGFGTAFAQSLITIVREGVEVILLLTMLVTLVAKTGQPRALRAIRWGVGLAVLASAATAVGLNLMVSSAQGKTREITEGFVMLAAAGVLFYVSYWLISQVESKRWMDFLKRQAARGVALGGQGTLALTAFLAVYREGAETALMYQAMIGGQGHSREGLTGLAAGLGVGLVLLTLIAVAIRATSVRLPLRAFFKVTGLVLFAMAVVFAGNGVFELQVAGILKTTPLGWLGQGVPALGLHPTVQSLSVQGLLLAGAALALLLILSGEPAARPAAGDAKTVGPTPTAGGVGV
jgi:high-affinity iron transporter